MTHTILNKGTPKTLEGAIQNGFFQIHEQGTDPLSPGATQIMEMHVRDYMAQHFGAALLKASAESETVTTILSAIYERITGKKVL